MAEHEVLAFRKALAIGEDQLCVHDLLSARPSAAVLDASDAVLIGGSGDHSVVRGGPWLAGALGAMETLYERSKPAFASCWGFQAFACALGGRVVTDRTRAEVGVVSLELTAAGQRDPVFGPLGTRFPAILGHEDIVTDLPPGAACLASSATIPNEAFAFCGKPIYAAQFHPELDREGLIERIAAYPPYLPLTGARSLEELRVITPKTPGATSLLRRFAGEMVRPAGREQLSPPGIIRAP